MAGPVLRDEITFTTSDVERFAAATSDYNPLHLDPRFARQTPYGRPVVHGALGALSAFSLLKAAAGRVVELRISFHHPIMIGSRIRITADHAAQTLRLSSGGLVVCTIRYRLSPEYTVGRVAGSVGPRGMTTTATETRVLDLDALTVLGSETGTHRPDIAGIRAILDNAALPDHLPAALAWASFWTGMCAPGRDALLCGLHVCFSPQTSSRADIEYRTAPPAVESRTGFVRITAALAGLVHAEVTVESLLRRPAEQATAESGADHLRPGRGLAGKTALVMGGSRGLGRAISLGLIGQGAHVLAVSRAPTTHIAEMQAGLGGHASRLHGVTADATDASTLRNAVPSDRTRLDGLVLCSTPPLASMPLHVEAGAAAAGFVDECVRHCWFPVAAFRDLLHPDAFVVVVSSTAVVDAPALWPHYAAAKGALEGFAYYLAKNFPWRVFIARPPRLRTDLTNTPLGQAGAVAPEAMAAEVVSAVLDQE